MQLQDRCNCRIEDVESGLELLQVSVLIEFVVFKFQVGFKHSQQHSQKNIVGV